MTPLRVGVVVLALLLGALMALGAWGQGSSARLSDEDYISIAISDPRVFHPTGATSGRSVKAQRVERSGSTVVVDLISDGIPFRVTIDARTEQVTKVEQRSAP